MKYLKVYENFMDSMKNSGIAADLEAGEMESDQIYADREAEDYGLENSQFGAEEILAKWEEAFSEKEPTTQDKYDFYADLREEGFDGQLVFDTLGDKMDRDSDMETDCCGTCNCTPCECPGDEEECPECTDDNCCPECKCDPCEC